MDFNAGNPMGHLACMIQLRCPVQPLQVQDNKLQRAFFYTHHLLLIPLRRQGIYLSSGNTHWRHHVDRPWQLYGAETSLLVTETQKGQSHFQAPPAGNSTRCHMGCEIHPVRPSLQSWQPRKRQGQVLSTSLWSKSEG